MTHVDNGCAFLLWQEPIIISPRRAHCASPANFRSREPGPFSPRRAQPNRAKASPAQFRPARFPRLGGDDGAFPRGLRRFPQGRPLYVYLVFCKVHQGFARFRTMLSTSYLQKLDTICLPRGAVPVPPGYVFGAMGRKVFLWMGLDAPGASAEAGFVSLAGGCNFIYARSIIYIHTNHTSTHARVLWRGGSRLV